CGLEPGLRALSARTSDVLTSDTGATLEACMLDSRSCRPQAETYCKAHGFLGAVDIVEINPVDLVLLCVPAGRVEAQEVATAELQSLHDACVERGPTCDAAAQRHCLAKGFAAASGPSRWVDGSARFFCL